MFRVLALLTFVATLAAVVAPSVIGYVAVTNACVNAPSGSTRSSFLL